MRLLNPHTMDLYCCLAQESMQLFVVFSVSMATTERVLASNFVVCMMELTRFSGQKHLCVKVSEISFSIVKFIVVTFDLTTYVLSQRAMSVSQIPANTMAHAHLVD